MRKWEIEELLARHFKNTEECVVRNRDTGVPEAKSAEQFQAPRGEENRGINGREVVVTATEAEKFYEAGSGECEGVTV